VTSVRICILSARVSVGNPIDNALSVLETLDRHQIDAEIFLTPELFLSGYTCENLFDSRELHQQIKIAVNHICDLSLSKSGVFVVGAPVLTDLGLYNCALIIHSGKLVAVIPKSMIPNHGEYYEGRYFDALTIGDGSDNIVVYRIGESIVPLSPATIVQLTSKNGELICSFTVELCEDMWTPFNPSLQGMAYGADLVLNLSASNSIFGKDKVRNELISAFTIKNCCSYVYNSAGFGESTNDLIWDGSTIIYQDGEQILCASTLNEDKRQYYHIALDIERTRAKRIKNKSIQASFKYLRKFLAKPNIVQVTLAHYNCSSIVHHRRLKRFPYLDNDFGTISDELYLYCLKSQAYALKRRLLSLDSPITVIGISGGLDSTHALLVLHNLYATEGWDLDDIHCFVMPSSASSRETQYDAVQLLKGLGLRVNVRSIEESVNLMLKQLGRDSENPIYDITYENIQAGDRTSFLFRYANMVKGIVIGTGDLSEIALGWCTYGVGDHMSHFNLNCGLPKTVIKAIIQRHSECHINSIVRDICKSVLTRDISPELLPTSATGMKLQNTESLIGNYDFIDFLLYHTLDSGPSHNMLKDMLFAAFEMSNLDPCSREQLNHDLTFAFDSFIYRFYSVSQFKREAVPNGPKILKNGSLSPRGDWRFPVDSNFQYNKESR
jgi:NAD+ synthase (glutamine-hydrolysing)